MQSISVAIVGGGPAGLCLARILQRTGIKVFVFEADASEHARRQGGSLDLHIHTGQHALRAAGVYPAFLAKIQHGADDLMIVDHNMQVVYEDKGSGTRPEIEREDLRDILLHSLDANTVQWGRKLLLIEPPADQRSGLIKLQFTDGSSAEADIVVGADGAWSKVRTVLTDLKPAYTGFGFVDVLLPRTIDLSAFKRGTLWAIDHSAHILVAHLGDAPHAYVGQRCVNPDELNAACPSLLTKGWAKELTALVTHPDSIYTARPIVALPSRSRWTRNTEWKSRVAIIGDAAHVMSPFAGEGANLALIDAADLAQALIKCRKREEIGPAIVKFERRCMWGRAEEAAEKSAANQELFVGPDGARGVAKLMKDFFSVRNVLRMMFRWIVRWVKRFFGFY